MGRLFGTDGVRGIANIELTPKLAFEIGESVTQVLTQDKHHKPTIIIGKDTRLSSDMLECALAAGICSMGGEAVLCGVIPTPAIAYLTRKYSADAGVVISASHNSYEYNGIKVFNSQGFKLRDELEDEVEEIILGKENKLEPKSYDAIGTVRYEQDAVNDYVDFVTNNADRKCNGIKVIFDCANGATSVAIKKYIKILGIDAKVLSCTPNGINVNDSCGSTHLDNLCKEVVANKADVGIAFDGDGDRMLAVNEFGEEVDGDMLIALFATRLKAEGKLHGNTAVVTTMSNMGFGVAMKNNGIETASTDVGDKYVLQEMIRGGYSVGGEQSGHIIFGDINTTGDGMLSALMLMQILCKENKPFSELAKVMERFPQVLINVKVTNQFKKTYNEDSEITGLINKYAEELGDNGRVFVRASGTEALIRIMLEGKDYNRIRAMGEDIEKLIKTKIAK